MVPYSHHSCCIRNWSMKGWWQLLPWEHMKNVVCLEKQSAVDVLRFIEKPSRKKVHHQLNNTFDRQICMLHSSDTGIEQKRAQVIMTDIQQQLWKMGVLRTGSPKPCVHFEWSNFCLQGVEQHYIYISHRSSMPPLLRGTYKTSLACWSYKWHFNRKDNCFNRCNRQSELLHEDPWIST